MTRARQVGFQLNAHAILAPHVEAWHLPLSCKSAATSPVLALPLIGHAQLRFFKFIKLNSNSIGLDKCES